MAQRLQTSKGIEREELDYLLSDTMPEELPPVFSYMPFYIFLTKRKNKNLFLKEKHRWLTTYFQGKDLSLKKPWAAFPYRFYISKGNDGDQRLLSMPQPVSAIEMSLFVSVFEHEFMNTFGTQGFSIRKPLRRKDVFYVNHKKSTILYSQSALVPGKNWIERSGSFFSASPLWTNLFILWIESIDEN